MVKADGGLSHVIRLADVSVAGHVEGLGLEVASGFKGIVRGYRDELNVIYRLLAGREQADSGRVEVFGQTHPGPRIRERRWTARLGLAHGDLHLVENLTIRRNLLVPLNYVMGIRSERAHQLVNEFMDRMAIKPWADLRPAAVPVHVRQITHLGRAVLPSRDVAVFLDPQEGMVASEASDVIGKLMSNVGTAVILCSERWVQPPSGFEEYELGASR